MIFREKIMPSRIDVRITDELKQNIAKFSKENDVKMPELLREILDLGLKEKQKQQENTKNMSEYYSQIAGRNDVAYRLQLEILERLVGDEKTASDIKNEAIKKAKEFREKILNRDII
jgi:hypothetical protein